MIAAGAQALQAYSTRARLSTRAPERLDFALCLPVGRVALETAQAWRKALRVALPAFGRRHRGGRRRRDAARHADRAGDGAADAALARAESRGRSRSSSASGADEREARPTMLGEGTWRKRIADALRRGPRQAGGFPLLDCSSELIHLECPLRLQLDAERRFETAARWLPAGLARRLTPTNRRARGRARAHADRA
jgi:hypothetical protein